VSLTGIFLIAAGVIVVLLVVVELMARVVHARFFSTVILGSDQRTSTSKTFIFMWTLLVTWGLIGLLIGGEIIHRHACVPPTDVANAASACKALHDQLGVFQVGWLHFLHTGLSGGYLILLGVPAAAGLAAAGITQSQVNGPGYKTTKPKPGRPNPFARITEIFSADDGTTDLGDFQYLIFNLITAVYFVAQFVKPDGTGLPVIPDTLLGLTSVSAGLYVGKKAVTRNQPAITGVFPLPLHDSQTFTVLGGGLTPDPGAQTSIQPRVTVDGMEATNVRVEGDSLVATAPAAVSAGGTPTVRQLQVLNPYGGMTANFSVPCL
jgi:hypothetical protein